MPYAMTVQDNDASRQGFTPAQYEVVNMMSCLRGDDDLSALKAVLVGFLNSRLQSELDRLHDDGTLPTETLEGFATAHLRTPYGAAR